MAKAKKAEPLSVEVAARAEAQLRFTLNFAEGILVALGSSLAAAASAAETPEVAEAIRDVTASVDKTYKAIIEKRSSAVSAVYKRARAANKEG